MNYTEIWKDVIGYEGLYQVSNMGNIRSLQQWNGHCFIPKIKILKLSYGTNDYWYIGLHKDRKVKRFCVHRLVAQAFIPNPNNLPVVMHKDDNPRNNNVDNLEWGTQKENCNTPQHNEKLSKSMMGKCGELNNFYGKTHTNEAKEKMSLARKQFKGGKSSRAKKVICEGIIYNCLKDCAEFYNVKYNTMRSWINKENPMPKHFIEKGLRWAYE